MKVINESTRRAARFHMAASDPSSAGGSATPEQLKRAEQVRHDAGFNSRHAVATRDSAIRQHGARKSANNEIRAHVAEDAAALKEFRDGITASVKALISTRESAMKTLNAYRATANISPTVINRMHRRLRVIDNVLDKMNKELGLLDRSV